MGAFDYLALDAKGRKKKGVMEGDTPRAVRQSLREQGLTPMEVTTASQKSSSGGAKRGHRGGISIPPCRYSRVSLAPYLKPVCRWKNHLRQYPSKANRLKLHR